MKIDLVKRCNGPKEKSPVISEQKIKVKLPKMEITKFQGTHLDWQRFWGKNEAKIDKADITQVAKFSYLKDLLEKKARMFIGGLSFTSSRLSMEDRGKLQLLIYGV